MPSRLLATVLLLLCATLGATSGEKPRFAGTWSDGEHDSSSFSLDLTQTGDRVSGYHIAIVRHGNRIDAALPEDGPPSINGTVQGDTAHVTFQSRYGDGTGEATLTLRRDTLEWKITSESGTHYLPPTSVLHREHARRPKTPAKAR